MTIMRKHAVRASLLGALAVLMLAAAPLASAHRWGLGISIAGPDFGIGYSGCNHCRGGGYVSAYAAPYYGGGGGYYAPAYYGGPAYYDDYASYGAVYYDRPVVIHRGYRDVRYHDRGYDRGYGYGGHHYRGGHSSHRAHYYDRGGRH